MLGKILFRTILWPLFLFYFGFTLCVQVTVTKVDEHSGQEQIIRDLERGSWFGEKALRE